MVIFMVIDSVILIDFVFMFGCVFRLGILRIYICRGKKGNVMILRTIYLLRLNVAKMIKNIYPLKSINLNLFIS